jgi:hypothetical protein
MALEMLKRFLAVLAPVHRLATSGAVLTDQSGVCRIASRALYMLFFK